MLLLKDVVESSIQCYHCAFSGRYGVLCSATTVLQLKNT